MKPFFAIFLLISLECALQVAGVPTIEGTYTIVEQDRANFEKYMKTVGVGFALRKLTLNSRPRTQISRKKNAAGVEEWTIKTIATFKTTKLTFQLGKEFDEVTGDGRKCKSTIRKEERGERVRFVHQQKCKTSTGEDQNLRQIREFNGNGPDTEMKLILEAPGVTSVRVYKKQPEKRQ